MFSGRVILILGCQRSGTTLLYMMLTSHPRISGFNEDEYFLYFNHFKEAENTIQFTHWYELPYNWIKNRWTCYKLPTESHNIYYLKKFFPHAKIIWIIRHPHAVIASMRSLYMDDNGLNWLNHENCGLAELKNQLKLFPKEKDIFINKADEITLGANIWKYKAQVLNKYLESNLDVNFIKYEDLLRNPQREISSLLNKIGLEWSDSVLHHEKYHFQKKYFGNNFGSKPIDKNRLKPVLDLTKEDLKKIDDICNNELMLFYR